MITLYRKYRPQKFNEIVGQNHIKMILQHEIEAGKIAHAYLFCGPRAVGKTTLARVLAKAANCIDRKEGGFEPCGTCENCLEITQGKSLDIVEIDAASHTGVDNVRENIIASARVAPGKLKRKIFIIDEVHMLSTAAFNALLKTLEEPPAFVIFILCTTEIHKVPATIISRCQRFDFKKINLPEVVKQLNYIAGKENVRIDKDVLEAIARNADGHLRDAVSLLGQLVNIGGKSITREEADLVIPRNDLLEVIALIESISKKDAAGSIRLVNRLIDEGADLKVFVNDLIEILRKILIMKISPSLLEKLSLDLGESFELKIGGISQGLSIEQIINHIEQFMRAANEIKGSFITQLPIEVAIVKICSGISGSNRQFPVQPSAAVKAADNEKLDGPVAAPLKEGQITFQEVLSKWNELLARIKKYNHSLQFILKVCQPKNLNGTELCLAFKYKFHKDRVSDANIKSIIERALLETFGSKLTFEAVIDEDLEIDNHMMPAAENNQPQAESEAPSVEKEAQKSDNQGLVDNLLKTFGGKVVG